MGAGLQVWNAAGQLIFDTPDRMGRITGVVTVSSAGSLTIAVPTGCTPFWFLSGAPSQSGVPSVSLSGNTLSWTAAPATIFYGYY